MTLAKEDLEKQALLSPKSDRTSFGPISLVVIQPTPFCNLDCDYCYLPDRQFKKQLSLDLIEPIFKTIFTSPFVGQDFTVCWHAGEPLTVPISFYEAALERIREAESAYNQQPCKVNYSFQTNATLINQAWCDFFRQYPIHVGVSIDGPAFIHDAHRKTRKGLGSHASTMRGIRFLQKNQINFNVIAVITEDSLDYADEIFNFFVDNGINDVGLNMEETEGINSSSSLDRHGIEERYRALIQRFWELAAQTNGEFKLREFEVICSLIYDNFRQEKTDMNHPFAIVNFDYQGNFSTFDPELLSIKTERYGDFILGNVLHDSLESVYRTDKFQQIYRDMAHGVEQCQNSCEYFGVCGGGAGSNKFWENGTFASTETSACKYRIKLVTDLVLAELENSLGLVS